MKDGNSERIILDLCGGTGSWSKPYRDAGYDVRVITLPQFDVLRWRQYPEIVEPVESGRVHGILAAPPCTMFSRARSTGGDRDFRSAMGVVRACLDVVWEARINGRLQFWALENPMGLLRQFLGKPVLSFEPWWYGDLHTKQTDLWGYFKNPRKVVHQRPITVERAYHNKNSKFFSSPRCPSEYKHLKLDRAAIRAITPPAFARAFFRANP